MKIKSHNGITNNKQQTGTNFLLPFKLEECEIPKALLKFHSINGFEEEGFELLLSTE